MPEGGPAIVPLIPSVARRREPLMLCFCMIWRSGARRDSGSGRVAKRYIAETTIFWGEGGSIDGCVWILIYWVIFLMRGNY